MLLVCVIVTSPGTLTGSSGAIRPGSTDVCVNVTAMNSARYTIAFQARQGACKSHPSGTATLEVAFVGFGKVTFNINLHCSCDAFCQSLVSKRIEKYI